MVEQNSQIQDEMVKIHNIILGFPSAGFKGNLLITNFSIVILNKGKSKKNPEFAINPIDENFEKFLGESFENDKQQFTENSKKESVNANAIIENQNKEINMLKSDIISLKNENNKLSSMKPVEKNLSLKGNFVE